MLYYVSIYISACCFEGCQVTVVAVSFSLKKTVGGFTFSSGQSKSHMLPVFAGQGCVFANKKYFFQICSLTPFVSDSMVVMIGVNLVLLAARIQMRKKRKKSQQTG